MHDWTRVASGIFHDFHYVWIGEIRRVLNSGLLPKGFYAMAEQIAGGPEPDILTLEMEQDDESQSSGETAVATEKAILASQFPPKVRYVSDGSATIYALKADRIAIRHVSGDRVVAFIELVSPGNKQSSFAVTRFLDKLSKAFYNGCHLIIIDPFPPGSFDPAGLHAEFWPLEAGSVTADEPLSLASYCAGRVPVAYFEPLAVGTPLPDFPLFLSADRYVNIPLETTYQSAWQQVPDRWKRVIEN